MQLPDLMELRTSNEAPFNHAEFTVWLHNKIIEAVRRDLIKASGNTISIEAALVVNKFSSLQIIK